MADAPFGGIPPTAGIDFTKTIHNKVEGPTDPTNNKVIQPFVVCVTGAGKGLGFHIALSYAKAGASGIVISSRTQSDLDALSKELKQANSDIDILGQTCDTMNEEDVGRLAEATRERFGRLDVCVANAGVISKYLNDGSLPKGITTDFDFERVIDINLLGTVRIARRFCPMLLETDGARAFIVITSLAAHWIHSQLTPIAYNISKRGVCHIVEQMSHDHPELLSYAVHPGAVVTPQTQNHSLQKGDVWDTALVDDVDLCGGFLTWLTKERRQYLSGRYLAVNWDVDELEEMKDDIVSKDLLKFKMTVGG
ncbi:hypothetical protein LTR37_020421 [Vermiconidia calcicola]|uniref:Uncharacterized protein n=1 Tax=Vermiconidia calcicola TaxID=1690605 RepID=A0ACC3MD98_9PEZI|nr:hypothetical protein LTR37_020421 [Vermiconidia calcicola]